MAVAPTKGQKTQALYALHWMPDLSPSARTVAAWLIWHANASTGRCDPGKAAIRRETGLAERTIKYALAELHKSGVVIKSLREGNSNSYQVAWQRLTGVVEDFEARAKTGGVVVPSRYEREGARICPPPRQKLAPRGGHEIAPKLFEMNSGKEHVFRVGTILANGAPSLEPDDDDIAQKILNLREDHAFVAVLDREVRQGRLFSRDLAELMYERLNGIHVLGDRTSDPVVGQAYRLIETVICREDAA